MLQGLFFFVKCVAAGRGMFLFRCAFGLAIFCLDALRLNAA